LVYYIVIHTIRYVDVLVVGKLYVISVITYYIFTILFPYFF
jgi:hypothetical protein